MTTSTDALPISGSDVDQVPTSGITSGLDLPLVHNPESLPDPAHVEDTSSYTPGILQVSPSYELAMNPEELSHLKEMLDCIQSMSISDGKTLVYDQVRLKADD